MATQTSFKNTEANVSLPVSYSVALICSESNLQAKIEEVASYVSRIYARFPRLDEKERSDLSKKGIGFNQFIEPPPLSECEQFEIALREKIIKDLDQKKCEDCLINLTTDYSTEKKLDEIATTCFKEKTKLYSFFPVKTSTTILLKSEKTKLYLNMNFRRTF